MREGGQAVCRFGKRKAEPMGRQAGGLEVRWHADKHTDIWAVELACWLVGNRMDRPVKVG